MKTLQEMLKEIDGSEALKNELKEIKDKVAFEEFLKKHDCEATAEDFIKLVDTFKKPEMKDENELDDDEVESVAGGGFIEDSLWDFCFQGVDPEGPFVPKWSAEEAYWGLYKSLKGALAERGVYLD